ncbi:Hypothetical protein A7982_00686 [Minicystis rosea]|nr:Hypothetical protein A7982_00686 [Minicystis rosea]
MSAALLVLALAGNAKGADPSAVQTAKVLFDAAVTDMAAKNFAAACPKLEEASRLVPEGIGIWLKLGECYEGQGRLASAHAAYELAESAAARQEPASERQRLAHRKAAALAPRLAKLRIVVTDEVRALPGLEIKRGGTMVGPVQWGLLLPADKGKHIVVVTAANGRKWEASAVIAEDGTQVDLRVELPPPVEPPRATPLVLPKQAEPEPTPVAARQHPRRIAGIAVGATGLATVVAGGVLGIVAIVDKNRSNANGACDAMNRCPPDAADLRRSSLRAGDWSTALFIGGGVALAGGVVLFATAPSTEKAPATAKLLLGPTGLSVAGAW